MRMQHKPPCGGSLLRSRPVPVRAGGNSGALYVAEACFPFGPWVTSKLTFSAFFQRLEAVHLDGREMREEVFATVIRRDEPVTLGVVEPLDRAVAISLLPYKNEGIGCLRSSRLSTASAAVPRYGGRPGQQNSWGQNANLVRALRQRSQVLGAKRAFLLKKLLQSSNIEGIGRLSSGTSWRIQHQGRERPRGRETPAQAAAAV